MLKSIRWTAWSLALLVLWPVGLAAQGSIYTNNDTTPNSISAYGFDSGGGLSQIPFDSNDPTSTFPTGGNGSGGGFYSSNRIIVVKGPTNDFLYASNSGNPGEITTVSAFTIDAGSGYLTPVLGSPFSTGAFNDSLHSGVSLAATPDGQFLFAGSTSTDLNFNVGSIAIFNIDPTTGALTETNKSPVAAGGLMSSMKVSPDGKYLVAALPNFNSGSNSGAIAVFAIRGPGNLRQVHNSPYVLSSGPATSVDFNCAANLLYAGGSNGNIYVFNFASGRLSPVTGSPFSTGAVSNGAVALSTDDSTLFASDPSSSIVTAFAVDANGGLTLPGTSANAAGSTGISAFPGGLAVSDAGNFLFSADVNGDASGDAGVSIFNLAGSSPIVFQSLTSTVLSSGFHSLAASPPKACTGAAAAAVVNGQ